MGNAKKLVDQVWDAVESGDLTPLDRLLAADVQQTGPGWDLRGVDATKELLGAYLVAFPDMRHHVVSWAETGDTVALELRVIGTHTGPLQTPQGALAPTGRTITFRSCDMITVRDGRISSWHVYFDQMSFLAQVAPEQVPAG